MLTDEAIPFMNEKVSEYLDSLSNGRYIVSFDTQGAIKSGEIRDKISVNVLDTYTRANQRLQLSGGQTRLVDIATILTLGDLQTNNLGIKVNLLIFDEIFDSLDEQNIVGEINDKNCKLVTNTKMQSEL
jgi:DNA repair exonuclease SbcCD ATPase subunit